MDSVLLQAEYFGVEAILRAVKSAAFRYINPADSNGASKDEACQQFDEKYGSISGAVQQCILPKNIRSMSRVAKKDHAQIIICKDKVVVDADSENPDPVYCTYCVWAEVPCLAPQDKMFPTFLEALNWLHRNGFVTKA